MILPKLAGFYVPWSVALAASSAEPLQIGVPLTIELGGLSVPVVQSVLAIAGVLLARPLAPRRDGERRWLQQFSVTLIMTIAALAWVTESSPGVLFTFIVSIGLGFSGYALIETVGQQIEDLGKRLLASMTAAIQSFGGKPR